MKRNEIKEKYNRHDYEIKSLTLYMYDAIFNPELGNTIIFYVNVQVCATARINQ